MDKVDHWRIREFQGVPFARETWTKWTTSRFDNFNAYYFRGKHGESGPLERFDNFKVYYFQGKHGQSGKLEGSTILRRTICEGNKDKVDHLRV